VPRMRKKPRTGAPAPAPEAVKPARAPRLAKSAAAAKPVKSASAGDDNAGSAILGGIEVAELRRLIRLVQRTGIGELEVSAGGRAVRISAVPGVAPAAVGHAAVPVASVPGAAGSGGNAGPGAPQAPAKSERFVPITSPMVGTFYRAPAPDADPYIEVGSMVEIGQTVCIVEAMKLMNEIESEVRGRVTELLVENAQPVEFGQKLFLIDPA
jgi:acetyl-CoA carboxylase biotin carboxyl carrier protein